MLTLADLSRKPRPKSLKKKMGFATQNKEALTNAERQRRWRLKRGSRSINATLPPDAAASLIYLRKEWAIPTDREVVEAALRFLALCTRFGLAYLPQCIEDDEDDDCQEYNNDVE